VIEELGKISPELFKDSKDFNVYLTLNENEISQFWDEID
jgi:hypothetical protein